MTADPLCEGCLVEVASCQGKHIFRRISGLGAESHPV